jgi:hypothetical protein
MRQISPQIESINHQIGISDVSRDSGRPAIAPNRPRNEQLRKRYHLGETASEFCYMSDLCRLSPPHRAKQQTAHRKAARGQRPSYFDRDFEISFQAIRTKSGLSTQPNSLHQLCSRTISMPQGRAPTARRSATHRTPIAHIPTRTEVRLHCHDRPLRTSQKGSVLAKSRTGQVDTNLANDHHPPKAGGLLQYRSQPQKPYTLDRSGHEILNVACSRELDSSPTKLLRDSQYTKPASVSHLEIVNFLCDCVPNIMYLNSIDVLPHFHPPLTTRPPHILHTALDGSDSSRLRIGFRLLYCELFFDILRSTTG